jgi:hypothetical protein
MVGMPPVNISFASGVPAHPLQTTEYFISQLPNYLCQGANDVQAVKKLFIAT